MPHDITERIVLFARVLSGAWSAVQDLGTYTYESVAEDWMQATWELLVECGTNTILHVYGGGADVYGKSERVTSPDAAPTHVVACIPRADDGSVWDGWDKRRITLPAYGPMLEELGRLQDGTYAIETPFDHVRMVDIDAIVPIHELRFIVRPLRPEEE